MGHKEEVIILHTNDLHFNFNHGNIAAEIIQGYRGAGSSVFLLNAGDIFVRRKLYSLEFYEDRGRYMIETMNAAGYDAAVLGNNELDYKETITRDNLRLARFPLLGANVGVDTDQFDPPEPYASFETARGSTLAVLGLTIPEPYYPDGIEVQTPEEALGQYEYLREECDVFVLLTHLGVKKDKELAQRFNRIDVIIGGQSHCELNPAEIVNGTLICQTGGHSPKNLNPEAPHCLGVISISLDNGEIIEKTGEVLHLDASCKRVADNFSCQLDSPA